MEFDGLPKSVLFGCLAAGVGLGFLFSSHIGWGFGMPAGVLMGLGIGVVLEQLMSSRDK